MKTGRREEGRLGAAAIPGWTSHVLIGCFFGALNALGVSILGEYVIRIYDQVRGRPLFVVDRTVAYIGGIFTGRESADQVGGPIRIAQISGQVATIGLSALIHLAAVLSVSIGLLNLFPVPLLDGGHLLFYGIEAIRGRPLSERAQEMGFRIGLALVVMLMIFATFNDIIHLAAS